MEIVTTGGPGGGAGVSGAGASIPAGLDAVLDAVLDNGVTATAAGMSCATAAPAINNAANK